MEKKPPFTPQGIFTRCEVADKLKISVCSVDRFRKKGLEAIKLPGGLVRFTGEALNTYLEEAADA